ncbi:MAG: hypothetical protein ACLVJH_14835 [Faecalibacterium prausnitzii]
MKLSDIKNGNLSAEWAEKGYELPKFDVEAVKAKTHAEPTWVHFGAGNIFRAFPAAVLNDALNSGKYDRGVIVAESFDYEIIDKAYQPYDNLSLLVCLKSTGEIEKKVVASVTESLKADYSFGAGLGTSGGDLPEPQPADDLLHHHREGLRRCSC